MKRIAVGFALLLLAVTGVLWMRIPATLAPPDETLTFDGLPLDVPQRVEFEVPEPEQFGAASMTGYRMSVAAGQDPRAAYRREVQDQIRDWLLFTVLGASGVPAAVMNEALYDVPPVRRGHVELISALEYGTTRSRSLQNRDVIALIPAGSPDEQLDALGEIADEQRKETGQQPRTIHVVEYEIGDDLASAVLKRRPSVDGLTLFRPDAGYVEREIGTAADLSAFLAQTNDLAYVRIGDSTITVGGRRLRSRPYSGIAVEDVAAIWQSDAAHGTTSGTGFSLDPQFEWSRLTREYPYSLRPFLYQFGMTPGEEAAVRRGFAERDAETVMSAIVPVCSRAPARDRCLGSVRQFLLDNRFQAARYDGSLQGTEVGMVLFYTDLLMKLWAQDYQDSTPRRVAGFPNRTRMEVAAIYRTEVEDFPNTRLWLGSREEAYQISPDQRELAFARTSTRVFAVPSDPISGKDRSETAEPHVYNRILVSWWNNHYGEVAQHEPQYQRLNEIMKWSQAIAWLNTRSVADRLSALSQVEVRRDYWFPDWVRRRPDLTFTKWDKIAFKPRGYEGASTEALDILSSREFDHFAEARQWSGGVSLARRDELVQRAPLSLDLPAAARRGRLDFAKSNATGRELRTLDNVHYQLSATGQTATTVARPNAATRLRGLISEFTHADIEKTIVRAGDGLTVSARTGTTPVGDLHIARGQDGFRVAWRAREVDAGQQLARQFSVRGEQAVLGSPDAVLTLRTGPNEFLVKLRDGGAWVRIAEAPPGSKTVREGFQSRVSGYGRDARSVDVAWVDQPAAATSIPGDAWIQVGAGTRSSPVIATVSPRGPPPAAIERTVVVDGAAIKVHATPDGLVTAKWADLPDGIRSAPEKLRALAVRSLDDPTASRMGNLMAAQDFRTAAANLVEDPVGFQRAIARHVDNEVAHLDALINARQLEMARARADALIATFGDRADFRFRRAVADIADGNLARGAHTLGAAREAPSDRFFQELNRRLADPLLPPAEREGLAEIGNLASWRKQHPAGSPAAAGQMRPVADRAGLRLEFDIDALAKAAGSPREDAVFYVQDTPGLNNIDWSASIHATLPRLVSGGRVDVRRLVNMDIGQYSPAVVFETQSRTTYRLVTRRPVVRAGTSYPLRSCESENNGDCREAYVVTERPSGSVR